MALDERRGNFAPTRVKAARAGHATPMDDAGCRRFELLRDADAPISRNFDPKLDPPRTIGPTDLVHASVRPRGRVAGREHNDPSATLRVIE